MAVYTPDPTYTEVNYAGPAVVAAGADNGLLICNVYRRAPGTTLRGVILFSLGGGFRGTALPSTLDDAVADTGPNYFQLWIAEARRRGYDTFMYALPVARWAGSLTTGNDLNQIEDTVLDLDNWIGTGTGGSRYGPRYRGNGMILLDNDSSPSLPAGYAGPLHPMQDPARVDWFKAHVMAMQWVVANRTTLGWDGVPMIAFGGSATADAHAWTLFGPDRAPYCFLSGSGQDALSTRGLVDIAILNGFQSWIPLWPTTEYLSGVALSTAPTGPNWASGASYSAGLVRLVSGVPYKCWVAHTSGASTEPGVGASWETVWFRADDWNCQSTTIASALAGSLEAMSCMSFIDDDPTRLAENRAMPVLLSSSDGTTVAPPYDTTRVAVAGTSAHDDAFAAMVQLVLGSNCKLLLNNASPTQLSNFNTAGVQYEVIAAGSGVLRNKQFNWLDSRVAAMASDGGALRGRFHPPRRPQRLIRSIP